MRERANVTSADLRLSIESVERYTILSLSLSLSSDAGTIEGARESRGLDEPLDFANRYAACEILTLSSTS